MNNLSKFVFLVLIFWGGAVIADTFGLETQIWPFMWAEGKSFSDSEKLNAHQKKQWAFSETNLGVYQSMGAKWNVVVIRQRFDDKLDWKRLDRIVEEHRKNNITVVFRLIEDPRIYDELLDEPDAEYAFNEKYYRWVRALAAGLQDKVDYFLIGNEVDHDVGFNLPKYKKKQIDFTQYEKLFRTARKAVRTASADIKLVDHGVSSFTLGLAVADELKKKDGIMAAFGFWNKFKYGRLGRIKGMPWLIRMLDSPSTKHRIEMARQTYQNCRYYDAVQFHHYFGAETLPQILGWIKGQLEANKCDTEIIATEVGYRIPFKKGKNWAGRTVNVADWSKYSSREHADTLVKDFVYLAKYGIEKMLYWQARFHHDRNPTATLFHSGGKADDFKARQAGKAYKYLVSRLQDSEVLNKGRIGIEHAEEMVFNHSGGVSSIIWSSKGEFRLPAERFKQIGSVRDIYGDEIDIRNGEYLKIGNSPVYIDWAAFPAGEL